MRYTKSAIAIAAAMSLLLTACGEDADNASGDATAPTDAAVEDTATSSDDAASGVDEPSPTTPAPVSGTQAQVDPIAVEGPAVVLDDENDQHWLLPWQDGFLSLRIEFGPTVGPELSEELAALLPQEVWDLFPDGLPPTLAEAQQIIADAGLLGVVLDAMAESEELSDAIWSGETPVEVNADFTTDGVDWESLPIELPIDPASIRRVVSAGDEIALFGGPNEDGIPPEHYVATSNGSLEDWSVETLAASPTDVPGDIFNVSGFGTFAANDDRWIVPFASEVVIDVPAVLRLARIEDPDRYGYVLCYTPEALIVHPPIFVAWEDIGVTPGEDFDWWVEEGEAPEPDEVLELAGIDLGNTEEFPGYGIDPEGMTIDLDPADIGTAGDAVRVAWEDTDLSAQQVTALLEAQEALGPDPYMTGYQAATGSWSAEWGGEPTYTVSDEDEPSSDIYAVDSGFLRLAERLEFSTDGAGWTPVDGAPADHEMVGTMPLDDGTVVLMNGGTGTRAFLVSSDIQQWHEVLVDGLPREFWSNEWRMGEVSGVGIDSAAEVVVSDSDEEPLPAILLLATADGETWIVDPIGSDDGSEQAPGSRAARNGSTVLLFGPAGWARYEMDG